MLLAAFGAWGMFRPAAPPGWDTPGEKVIIASESTTRYVVLSTDGKKELHPVLNMASAKLLLDPAKGEVVKVDESILDKGTLPHGATLGIPYAPDRLPTPRRPDPPSAGRCASVRATADAPSRRPRSSSPTRTGTTDGASRLTGGELLYVVGAEDKNRYVVDARGTKYEVGADELLLRALVGAGREPERVSKEWLETLRSGDPITFPRSRGRSATRPGARHARPRRRPDRHGPARPERRGQPVLPGARGRVSPVSDFTAKLLLNSRALGGLMRTGQATDVNAAQFTPGGHQFGPSATGRARAVAVNDAGTGSGSRNTVCNVLRDVDKDNGATTLSTWAGTDFPRPCPPVPAAPT